MRKSGGGSSLSIMQFHGGAKLGLGVVLAAALALPAQYALAFEIAPGNPDLKISWDNTLKYSAAWRVKSRDPQVEGSAFNPNLDDGDRNFDKGLISNRVDLLSEFDFVYQKDLGFRVSAAGWYDSVYNRTNDNDSAATYNATSVANTEFPDGTRRLHGRKAEFLDTFVFGKFTPADMGLNLRAGRFTQLYGESLFFGGNGIAAAQTSPDIVKLLSVPSSQFKEILRPVGQLSAQLQISPQLSLGAYYQVEWRKARLPGAGSYFSFADFVDDGGERLFTPLGPLPRGADIEARDSGQGGAQVRFKSGDVEYGIYAARFHDKFPQFYVRPLSGDYAVVYAQDIKVYGVSASTVFGETNVAAEMSVRRDAPLAAVGNVVVALDPSADGRGNPFYPVGNTFHAQVSAISVFPANVLWEGASFIGELAFNRRLSVRQNADQLDPRTTRDATALRFIFQPEYFQLLPGVDVQVPIGVGYGLSGRTSVLGTGFSAEHGGDVSIGIKADYQKTWQSSLTYTHFYGRTGAIVNPQAQLSFDQFHKDRDFVALSIQRTF